MKFKNRNEAAEYLATRLLRYRGKNPLVLAIPRGAAVMSRIIADKLGGQMDVVLVRKLRAPHQPELAIGSVDEHGNVFLTAHAQRLGATEGYVALERQLQLDALRSRRRMYARAHSPIDPHGRIVIVVDDGIATGATMTAALKSVRSAKPAELIVATAVAPPEAIDHVRDCADEVVCLMTPADFQSVGQYFEEFVPVTDDEVVDLLKVQVPLGKGEGKPAICKGDAV
jgi:predicted phosphoribosyltransferase